MSILEIKISYHQNLDEYIKKHHPNIIAYRIISKSLDARKAPQGKVPQYLYRLEYLTDKSQKFHTPSRSFVQKNTPKYRPIIVGAGPAGLFAALRLLDHGIRSIIIERGDASAERMKKIAKYWRYGELDENSNVCFGEGGAGLYSDGKLITRIKSDEIPYVMSRLVEFGAPRETAYLANPHLGSNKIRQIISELTNYLVTQGCEVRCLSHMIDFDFDERIQSVTLASGETLKTHHMILATGHSAQDIYRLLVNKQLPMEGKDFAVGVRVEHSRRYLDKLQYGSFAGETLGAARYRLSYHDHSIDRGGYSFCMCPGGYVLNSAVSHDGLVSNGMSNYACNSPWSNGAVVVSVDWHKDITGNDILKGVEFVEQIERKAKLLSQEFASGKELPAMTMEEFLSGNIDWQRPLPKYSCPSKVFKADIRKLFPDFILDGLSKSLMSFNRDIPGFINSEALMVAPETRTSAPVRIIRDKKTLMCPSVVGLYPTGEGAGYAGGITSAAVDGIKVASALVNSL